MSRAYTVSAKRVCLSICSGDRDDDERLFKLRHITLARIVDAVVSVTIDEVTIEEKVPSAVSRSGIKRHRALHLAVTGTSRSK